ncbi:RICIN domain-containing protein [Actinoplanes sp. NPDC049265]|uniref:RICIN domain-containing protein n=1 Tax=Actinoplanes sp. NPDC049265 TaxID=3363902 RepID=UPI0037122106
MTQLIVTAGPAILWELLGKRAFARELLEPARAAAEFDSAGNIRDGLSCDVRLRHIGSSTGGFSAHPFVRHGRAANLAISADIRFACIDGISTMTSFTIRRSVTLVSVAASVLVGMLAGAGPASAGPLGSIRNVQSEALQPVSATAGSSTTTEVFTGTTIQRWKIVGAANQPAGIVNIKLIADQSLCLARSSNLMDGAIVKVNTCGSGTRQLWQVVPSGSLGGSHFIDPSSLRAMTDEDANGVVMRSRTAGAINQLWA